MRLLLISVFFIGVQAFGYDFPILQKTLGGLDKDKGVIITKNCQIFDDHFETKLDDVLKLIRDAEKEPLTKFLHIKREVPSKEVFANYPEKYAVGPAATGLRAKKVVLLIDSSSGQHRNGPASEQLMKLVKVVCKDL